MGFNRIRNCVKGLTIPLISESDSAPVLRSGKFEKSQTKVLSDLAKRGKTLYEFIF
jgi:hypothetical protein